MNTSKSGDDDWLSTLKYEEMEIRVMEKQGLTLAELTSLVQHEYEQLCNRLNLTPVTMDIYVVDYSGGNTVHGTPRANDSAAFSPNLMLLPYYDGDLEQMYDYQPKHPPVTWDRFDPLEWPVWRIELWHEAIHQIECQITGDWSPGNEHGKSWQDAISHIANKYNVAIDDIIKAVL